MINEKDEQTSTPYDPMITTGIEEELRENYKMEVFCKPVKCQLGDIIYFKTEEDMIEMHICKELMNLNITDGYPLVMIMIIILKLQIIFIFILNHLYHLRYR